MRELAFLRLCGYNWPSQVQGQGNSFTLEGPAGPVSGTVALEDGAQGAQGVLRFTADELLSEEARYTARALTLPRLPFGYAACGGLLRVGTPSLSRTRERGQYDPLCGLLC